MVARAGVTLVELLIVLVIMGIVVALAVPFGAVSRRDRSTDTRAQLPAVVDTARRLAVQHAVSVRVRIERDGVWSVSVPGAAAPLATGRLPEKGDAGAVGVDLTVDPLGSCRPIPGWRPDAMPYDKAFDAGRCRWADRAVVAGVLPP